MGRNNNNNNNTKKSRPGRSRNAKSNSRFRGDRDNDRMNESCESSYNNSKSGNPNDPSWYIADTQLLNDVASVSYATATGANMDPGYTALASMKNYNNIVPGIMAMHIYPGPGISRGTSDAVNIAANMIYARIRSVISGSRPYDAPDLMMYILGADHAYMYLSWMQRLYGLMNVYSSMNRYMPDDLVYANGVNAEDLRKNLSNFRTYINQYALQLSVLYVPADIPIFSRHYWLYQNVWTDADSAKAQFYMYVPYGFGTYEEQTSSQGGIIKFNSFSSISDAGWTLDNIITMGNMILNKLILSEDIATISGDVRKTYGEGNSLKASTIDEVYSVIPVKNDEILSQVENLTCFGLTPTDLNVTQNPDTNVISWDVKFAPGNGYASIKDYSDARRVYLSTHGNATTPADNLVMTRLHSTMEMIGTPGSADAYFRPYSCGSEIVIKTQIVLHSSDPTTTYYGVDINTVRQFNNGDLYTPVLAINALSKFDWHPLMYTYVTDSGKTTYTGLNADLDEYALVNADVIDNMNDVAILGEFGIPYRTFN